jgi:hypothetical protein
LNVDFDEKDEDEYTLDDVIKTESSFNKPLKFKPINIEKEVLEQTQSLKNVLDKKNSQKLFLKVVANKKPNNLEKKVVTNLVNKIRRQILMRNSQTEG